MTTNSTLEITLNLNRYADQYAFGFQLWYDSDHHFEKAVVLICTACKGILKISLENLFL